MATYQQQHFDNIKSQRHGSAWMSKTIRQLWLIMWRMWNHRNKASKAKLTPQLQSKLKNLRLIIRQEFAAGKTGLLPEDFHLIDPDAREATMMLDVFQAKEWVDRMELARKCYVRTEKRQQNSLKASQQCMTRFLSQANQNNTKH